MTVKKCPYCAEEIHGEAIKCKHCGSSLDDGLDEGSTPPAPARDAGRDTLDGANTLDEQKVLGGRYRVIREIGHGGMGAVYLAHDDVLDIDVAVKLLPALLARDRHAMDGLKREARTAMRLRHPNIVAVHTLEEAPEATFLVMEYVEGQTLDDLIHEKGKLTLDELLPIAEQAAAGLDYAHSQGVVHRDVKPSNILLARDGTAKIADFGIAREMKQSQTRLTGQQTSGTLLYMSPEQVMGEDLDARSDIYSFGAVLYECLSGHPPFTSGDISKQICEKRPSDLRDAPDHVNAAVQAALAKAVEDRPATAGALVERLREKPTPVLKPPPSRPVVEPEPKREPPARPKPPEPVRRGPPPSASKPATRPRRMGKVLAGLVVVGILVVVIVVAAQPGGEKPRIDPGTNGRSQDGGTAHATGVLTPAEAREKQRQAARDAGVAEEITINLGGGVTMKMALIPAGTFTMGSPAGEKDRDSDETQHEVTLTKPFYIGVHEVTCAQFARFVAEAAYKTDAEKEGWAYAWNGRTWGKVDGASWRDPGFRQEDAHPVTEVSWNDAKAFCRWVSGKVRGEVRLPTEAEWEYACRAGTKTAYQWGDDPDKGQGWCNGHDLTSKEENKFPWKHFNWRDGFAKTAPVGSFKRNAWGLYDMHGNVWEWCNDRYGKYEAGVQVDPRGLATSTSRVVRGGSWINLSRYCRSANRYIITPSFRNFTFGFRCARTVLPSAP